MGTNLYAVFGNPVRHSKSPTIHEQFAAQFGFDIDYRAIEAPLDGFRAAVSAFRDEGGKGCNVTVPFKQEAWQLADRRSARAEIAGAANTLRFDDGIYGDNTDGIGLVRDLTVNLGVQLFEKRILVLGAGGAVRGIIGSLLEQGPRRLLIANRTPGKAVGLAKAFAAIGPIEPLPFDALAGRRFDIIINGTAASLAGELPPLPPAIFERDSLAYDLMYADRPTPFLQWAAAQGAARTADGLGMLVEQGAESFFLWWGVRPETAPVIAALRTA